MDNQYHDLSRLRLDESPLKDTSNSNKSADCATARERMTKSDDKKEFLEDRKVSSADSSTSGYKCSAVHTLERDMPDFDYSHLVHALRDKIVEECSANPGTYSYADLEKCKSDDWFLSRFLLRQKLDVNLAFDMLKRAMRFRHESLSNSIRRQDFPAEFYQIGGLFGYEPDRKGNRMMYIRVRVHKKIPEIGAVLQAFLYSNIQQLDEEAGGKGISIVFDCSGGGLANADMDMLLFLVSTLVNYFPKGLSYLLVHELPWILKPFWHIAKAWISDEHRQLIKFSNSRTIFEYIDKENLPDFMGGTCKRDYRAAPENCTTMEEAAKLWGVEQSVVKSILSRFAEHLPASSLDKLENIPLDNSTDSDRENNCGDY